jgi:hypothetical protein
MTWAIAAAGEAAADLNEKIFGALMKSSPMGERRLLCSAARFVLRGKTRTLD